MSATPVAEAFGISPASIQIESALPEQVYSLPLQLSDSSLGQERSFHFTNLEGPIGLLNFAENPLVLNANSIEETLFIELNTEGLALGSYPFSFEVKQEIEELEDINQIIPGLTISGEIQVTDQVLSDLRVSNLRIIKDESEASLAFALSLSNKGNLPDKADRIELRLNNSEGEEVHFEEWSFGDELPAFQEDERIYEVNTAELNPGIYALDLNVFKGDEILYESNPMTYQVLEQTGPNWMPRILPLFVLAVSLYLYFSSRPNK